MGVSMAYEIRIYPNAAQREPAERTFGCCRWACSRCLEARNVDVHWEVTQMVTGS